jgi:hypothetical protein
MSRLQAAIEAADTGGTVMRVHALEIRSDSILLIGTLPSDAVQVDSSSGAGRTLIQPRSFGKLHTTPDPLTQPRDPVGFLVLHHPVKLVSGQISDEGEVTSAAAQAARCSMSLPRGFIGPACCVKCNEPIAEHRMKAIPGVRICTKCQRLKEEAKNE